MIISFLELPIRAAASPRTADFRLVVFIPATNIHVWREGALRFNYKLTTSFQYTHNNISLAEGRVTQNLLVTRVNYGFTTTMFLNALIQYNSDNKQWSSNVRFNIIHRPLSDIFVVYNEHRDSVTGNLIDRALIAKMTYMISR